MPSEKRPLKDPQVKPDDLEEELDDNKLPQSNDINNMMAGFQSNFSKKNEAKRKKTEVFLTSSVKLSSKKVEEIQMRQSTERKKLSDQYNSQISELINTWEGELGKSKDHEEKLATAFRQQQKFYTQLRTNQNQILKNLQTLHTQYDSAVEDLEKLHSTQQNDMQSDLRREVSMLQKKFLMESQQTELATMKKNMQQLLASSF